MWRKTPSRDTSHHLGINTQHLLPALWGSLAARAPGFAARLHGVSLVARPPEWLLWGTPEAKGPWICRHRGTLILLCWASCFPSSVDLTHTLGMEETNWFGTWFERFCSGPNQMIRGYSRQLPLVSRDRCPAPPPSPKCRLFTFDPPPRYFI